MSKTMRAIMCREPWDYRLEKVPMPEAGPGEVVIKVNACGDLCQRHQMLDGRATFLGG